MYNKTPITFKEKKKGCHFNPTLILTNCQKRYKMIHSPSALRDFRPFSTYPMLQGRTRTYIQRLKLSPMKCRKIQISATPKLTPEPDPKFKLTPGTLRKKKEAATNPTQSKTKKRAKINANQRTKLLARQNERIVRKWTPTPSCFSWMPRKRQGEPIWPQLLWLSTGLHMPRKRSWRSLKEKGRGWVHCCA